MSGPGSEDQEVLNLELVVERLAEYRPREALLSPRRAAVASVLRFDRGAPEVLLMERVRRESDRWSGHVSFPGGREEEDDPDLLATAVRETREEVGLDLTAAARPVGRLDTIRAVARGKVLPMSISPYVFVLEREAPLVLGPEAESAFWFPLDRAATGELSSDYVYAVGPARLRLPCWRWEGYTVWGLTYRMLTNLLKVVS